MGSIAPVTLHGNLPAGEHGKKNHLPIQTVWLQLYYGKDASDSLFSWYWTSANTNLARVCSAVVPLAYHRGLYMASETRDHHLPCRLLLEVSLHTRTGEWLEQAYCFNSNSQSMLTIQIGNTCKATNITAKRLVHCLSLKEKGIKKSTFNIQTRKK